MRAYIVRRLLLIIPTLLVASLTVFFVIRLIPGSIIDQMVNEQITFTEMDKAKIERELGLDVAVHIQYVRWVADIFRGDLGESLWTKASVTREIVGRLPVTIELGLMAMVVGLIIALPIGVYSAIRQDTGIDYVSRTFAIIGLATPNFWLGTMVMVFPPIWWGWSPPIMLIPFTEDPLGNLGMFIIPAIILGTAMAGITMRMTRTMMLEVLRQDYIRTAWSKGLRERVVVTRHAWKNAFIPVVTIIGLQVPVLVGGAVIMEQIFVLPGIGRLMLDAISQRDYPVVSGVMLVMAVFVLIVNLVVDLTYGYLDPRVHYK